MSFAVAVLVAAGLALFGLPFRSYHFWYSWTPKVFCAGFLGYLAIAGFGGGFVGWLPGQLGVLTPTTNDVLNGLIFGFAGSLAVRADFGGRAPAGAPEARRAASLIGKSIDWTSGMLDQVACRAVANWAKNLSDAQLLELARDISYGIGAASPAVVPGKAKVTTIKTVTDAMAAIGSADPTQQDDARARLTQFCLRYICAERVPKPAPPQK
ncbi:hypothetical protein [Actinoplanes sp. NPDC051859]|uniref:hypothetical protein n=1 Tax=Actinoplanes sp. NPDC051859 TaxID=3363909 RepID=UPI0037AF966A